MKKYRSIFLHSCTRDANIWIGARDVNDTVAGLYWTDGTTVDYVGTRDLNSPVTEPCLRLRYTDQGNWEWWDKTCLALFGYICKRTYCDCRGKERKLIRAFNQFMSGMGPFGVLARRRVHLATVLLRPPSGHRTDRRQTRHTHILQIGFRLSIAQADVRPVMPISFR